MAALSDSVVVIVDGDLDMASPAERTSARRTVAAHVDDLNDEWLILEALGLNQ